jgi:choline dehydrogenase
VKPEVKSGFALPGVCSVYNPVSFYPGQRVELEFDYVIIGAGSAGCVLANRLSASGKNTVLVLEAGGSDRRFWIQTPIGYGKTFFDPAVNWMYTTEKDPGINNRQSYWPRGKVLGGSSSINAMVYIRGQAADYDDWRDLGNDGWGWDEVLPYFIKAETWSNGGNQYRGADGPLHVSNVSSQHHPLCQRFFSAASECGFEFNPDFNGANQEGVGYYQITTRNGRRMSAARAYLHPALKRDNCNVITRDRQRRFDQFSPGAAAIRHRRCRTAEKPGHRSAGGAARSRPKPAGSSRLLLLLSLAPADP